MRIEFLNKPNKPIDCESGDLVKYGDEDGKIVYGYGIILKDTDDCNTVIFDLEDNVYYSDVHLYTIFEVISKKNKIKIVVEDED